jgi:hypothetical protein
MGAASYTGERAACGRPGISDEESASLRTSFGVGSVECRPPAARGQSGVGLATIIQGPQGESRRGMDPFRW